MMRLIAFLITLFCLFPNQSVAQDSSDDLRKTLDEVQLSYNTCDTEAIIALYETDSKIFENYGLLSNFSPQEVTAYCEQGGSYDFTFEVAKIDIMNGTGVLLFYNRGTATLPSSDVIPVNDRLTTIWAKNGAEWKIVHIHMSAIE